MFKAQKRESDERNGNRDRSILLGHETAFLLPPITPVTGRGEGGGVETPSQSQPALWSIGWVTWLFGCWVGWLGVLAGWAAWLTGLACNNQSNTNQQPITNPSTTNHPQTQNNPKPIPNLSN